MTDPIFSPKKVLAVAAHPDDVDFGFAGSIAKWAKAGAKIYYLIITDGSKGTDDRSMPTTKLVKMREDEQRAAAKLLGAKDVFFLGYPDSELMPTLELKKQLTKYIRQLKPDTVLFMDPTMIYSNERGYGFINHPDHRVAGQMALDAVFPLARDHLAFPELLIEGFEPHKVSTILMINFEKHNFAVDISSTLEMKVSALGLHKSQIADLDNMQEMVKDWAEACGKQYGYNYAEAFVRLDIRT